MFDTYKSIHYTVRHNSVCLFLIQSNLSRPRSQRENSTSLFRRDYSTANRSLSIDPLLPCLLVLGLVLVRVVNSLSSLRFDLVRRPSCPLHLQSPSTTFNLHPGRSEERSRNFFRQVSRHGSIIPFVHKRGPASLTTDRDYILRGPTDKRVRNITSRPIL